MYAENILPQCVLWLFFCSGCFCASNSSLKLTNINQELTACQAFKEHAGAARWAWGYCSHAVAPKRKRNDQERTTHGIEYLSFPGNHQFKARWLGLYHTATPVARELSEAFLFTWAQRHSEEYQGLLNKKKVRRDIRKASNSVHLKKTIYKKNNNCCNEYNIKGVKVDSK